MSVKSIGILTKLTYRLMENFFKAFKALFSTKFLFKILSQIIILRYEKKNYKKLNKLIPPYENIFAISPVNNLKEVLPLRKAKCVLKKCTPTMRTNKKHLQIEI